MNINLRLLKAVVFVFVVVVYVVVIVAADPRNLPLKFGQNWVINS